MSKEIHDKYINLYKEKIKENPNYARGAETFKHGSGEIILNLMKKTNSKTLLDYGCGQGKQYFEKKFHEKNNIPLPTLYDPAVEAFSNLPSESFDGIITTDVFEHIPKEVIPMTLEYIFSHAKKFVYIKLATNHAKNLLPNGENAHCTVETYDWWKNKINEFRPDNILVYLHESQTMNKSQVGKRKGLI
ncbi:MAG: methyltransferase domain-containing protein [Acholeplasmataceae bacterium]